MALDDLPVNLPRSPLPKDDDLPLASLLMIGDSHSHQ
jgi:hypothetical protein